MHVGRDAARPDRFAPAPRPLVGLPIWSATTRTLPLAPSAAASCSTKFRACAEYTHAVRRMRWFSAARLAQALLAASLLAP